MTPGQFTERAFDRVALMHLLLKGLGALFDPASLQKLVVLAHDQRAILLVGWNALLSQRAALAVALAPLKTVRDFGFAVLANAAAAPAFVAGGTVSASVDDVDAEGFDLAGEPAPAVAGWPGRGPSSSSLPRPPCGGVAPKCKRRRHKVRWAVPNRFGPELRASYPSPAHHSRWPFLVTTDTKKGG
jgi:hypothetical protein